MSFTLPFLVVLAVMVIGTVFSVPVSRRRARRILERQRRLTDNDPRLIEALGIKDAAINGILGRCSCCPVHGRRADGAFQ